MDKDNKQGGTRPLVSERDSIKLDIKADPFIYNLFTNDEDPKKVNIGADSSAGQYDVGHTTSNLGPPDEPGAPQSTSQAFDENRSMNWITIPTTFIEEEKDPHSSITMLSVYTYSSDESQKISKFIKDPKQIVFTNDGHVAVDFGSSTSAKEFYPNPLINKNRGGETGQKEIGIANTVFQQNSAFKASFIYDENVLFSQNLRWILYKLPGAFYSKNTGTGKITITKKNIAKNRKDSIPVYVLLYNPVHRKNFQDIYAKIINFDNNPFSVHPFIGTNGNYLNTMKKYCNAFTVSKFDSPNTAKTLVHYADPSCSLSLDPQVAKLSIILGLNITRRSLQNDFYRGGINGFNAALKDKGSVPLDAPYCGRGSGDDPGRFLRTKTKAIVTNDKTESFMQILSNYHIATSGEESDIKLPQSWDPKRPGDTRQGIGCSSLNLSFVDCSVSISTQGELDLNKNTIQPVCGNDKPSSGGDTPPSGGDDTDGGDKPPSGGDEPPEDKNFMIYIYISIAILLIILAIVGYLYFKKK